MKYYEVYFNCIVPSNWFVKCLIHIYLTLVHVDEWELPKQASSHSQTCCFSHVLLFLSYFLHLRKIYVMLVRCGIIIATLCSWCCVSNDPVYRYLRSFLGACSSAFLDANTWPFKFGLISLNPTTLRLDSLEMF